MEFTGQLHDLDSLYLERRELEIATGRLHADIWRLRNTPDAEAAKVKLNTQIQDNTRRTRTINYLITKIRLSMASP